MTMTLLLTRYASTLSMRYDAKDAGNLDLEDSFLDQLDELWLQMSDDERRACDQVAQETKQRHRLLSIIASTSSDCWTASDARFGGSSWAVSFAVCDTLGAQAQQARAPARNPLKSSSRSTAPFEPMAAFG